MISSSAWSDESFFESLSSGGEISDGEIERIFSNRFKEEILKALVTRNRKDILRKLFRDGLRFVNNVSLDLWKELITLAVEEEFFELYQELKKVESEYEKALSIKIDYQYKNVLGDISQLHADIFNAKIFEVEQFVRKYPKLKLCYGSSDFCALERSIDARQFHTYAFLRAKGFYSDKGQELKDKIQTLDDDDKEKIRDEIAKFTISDPETFISLVLTKCELDVKSSDVSFNEIREMLQALSQIEEFKPILKILAISDVRIIFDFKNEFVTEVDPFAGEYVLGYTYFKEGLLYIGKNQSRAQRFGTFAHEATHFVLNLLYENSCLPYRSEDKERERVWEGIVRRMKEIYERNPSGTDNIIKWVYELYDPGYHQKAELIVRVNDLLAFYHENPQKCEEVRETYRELFEFYRDHVMPDLTADAYRTIKLNNDFELFEKIRNSNFQVKDSEKFPLLEFKENVQKKFGRLSAVSLAAGRHKNFFFLSDVPQLTLSKLFQEISKKSSNKLEAKVKNIFINFERLQQESLRNELEEVLKNSEQNLRIIINLKNDDINPHQGAHIAFQQEVEKNLKFLRKSNASIQIFFIASLNCESNIENLSNIFTIVDSKLQIRGDNVEQKPSMRLHKAPSTVEPTNSLKLLKVEHKLFWDDLSESSKEKILKMKIKFRQEELSLLSIFPRDVTSKPSSKILNSLSSQNCLQIKPQEPNEIIKFIDRKFSKSKRRKNQFWDIFSRFRSTSLDLNEFIDQTRNDKIVVISDLAGMGKTTLLHKVHEKLNENIENSWVCFVSLLKYKEILRDRHEITESFLKFMTNKILNLGEIEKKIFELKYKNNQVVILFDGFDEISPDCKKNAMKIFKLHKKSEKSQIWITTRTHLEKDLERELQVEAHKIEPLDEEEQIEFLCKFWEETCVDSNLREKCAKILVKKIAKSVNFIKYWFQRNESLTSIALQIRLLGEYFKDKLCENFHRTIQNFSFSQIYEFLIEKSLNIKDQYAFQNSYKLHSDIYEALAMRVYAKNTWGSSNGVSHHLFGFANCIKNLKEKLEELTRGGIISYDQNGEIYFLHKTIEKFFVVRFLSDKINNFKRNWQYAREFCHMIYDLLGPDFNFRNSCNIWEIYDISFSVSSENARIFLQYYKMFISEKEGTLVQISNKMLALISYPFSIALNFTKSVMLFCSQLNDNFSSRLCRPMLS